MEQCFRSGKSLLGHLSGACSLFLLHSYYKIASQLGNIWRKSILFSLVNEALRRMIGTCYCVLCLNATWARVHARFSHYQRWLLSHNCVGTPPLGKHVARNSWWRVARVISRTIIIRIPLRICMVQLSYPDSLKERQTTFQLLLSKEEQMTLAERRHPDSLHNTSG